MPERSYQYISLEYLETITGGDIETGKTILNMLLNDLETLCPKLYQSTQANHWEEVEKIAHKLKSSLAFAGNDSLTTSNEIVLENARLKQELERIPLEIDKMEALIPLVIAEINEELSR